MNQQSEVMRLMQQIDQECESMGRGMSGLAQMASHEFIHQKYQNLDAAQQQLAHLIGEKEATQVVVDTYIKKVG